jgi:hypothetical protein
MFQMAVSLPGSCRSARRAGGQLRVACGRSWQGTVRMQNERQGSAEAVSKRTLQSRTLEIGLRERPTTASERVGKGKATPQNLEIYCFDTAWARSGLSPVVGECPFRMTGTAFGRNECTPTHLAKQQLSTRPEAG